MQRSPNLTVTNTAEGNGKLDKWLFGNPEIDDFCVTIFNGLSGDKIKIKRKKSKFLQKNRKIT